MFSYRNFTSRTAILFVLCPFMASALAYGIVRRQAHTQLPAAPAAVSTVTPLGTEPSAKQNLIENASNPPTAPVTTQTSNPPKQSENIELSAQAGPNDSITVISKLTGISSGSCNLKATSASGSYEASAGVIFQPEYSTCAGFSIPIKTLGTGALTLTLRVSSGGSTSEKTITYVTNQ